MEKINIAGLAKAFGKTVAVDIPQLSVCRSEMIGLAGNNGAGKTTLLRLMLDLLKADAGRVLIDGADTSKSDAWKRATGSYIDAGFLIDYLLPEEFFRFVGNAYDIPPAEIDRRLALFNRFMNGEILQSGKYIRSHSAGNRQKIGIIAAMIVEPSLLILDEPFNFLDPSSQIELKQLMRKMNGDANATIFLSTHNLSHLMDFSTRILVMEKGRIVKDLTNVGSPAVRQELEKYFIAR